MGRIILSCIRAPLCAECNGAVIDALAWAHLMVPPCAFAPRPFTKEVDRALSVPDADGKIRTGHYDIIQVSEVTGRHALLLDSFGEGPNLVPRLKQRLRCLPPEVDGR